MTAPVSVRLDDDVHITLEVEAHRQGIGLGTLLRPRRREVRRKRIRARSEAVGRYVAADPEARQFFGFWGTPTTDPG
jgi:hypothetical protein